jgi:hypothetical protein
MISSDAFINDKNLSFNLIILEIFILTIYLREILSKHEAFPVFNP